MGTHPIFESDFDCLTEMFALRRSMALTTRVALAPKGEPTTASTPNTPARKIDGAHSKPKLTPAAYKPSRHGGYTTYTGVVVDDAPIPKIQALQRRLQRFLAEMPEDYSYRVTMSTILEAEMDKVNNLQSDLDALEEALGQDILKCISDNSKWNCAVHVHLPMNSPGENYSHQHQRTNGNVQSKLFCPETQALFIKLN